MGIMRIFSERRYLAEKQPHVVMLYPFWGNHGQDPSLSHLSHRTFDRYTDIGHRFFEMVPLENADIAVLPTDWRHICTDAKAKNLAIEFADLAKWAGKKVAIFFCADSDEAVPIENAIVFRTSFNHSQRRSNEFAMPVWCDDFVEEYSESRLALRGKIEKPVVGFCGHAYSPRTRIARLKTLCLRGNVHLAIRELRTLFLFFQTQVLRSKIANHIAAQFLRTRVMRMLSRSELVQTNFVVRDHFLGGALLGVDGINVIYDLDLFQKMHQDYVHNMLDSDYALCVRGAGNFSLRFYEAMSCGRVPLFVDTDCALPYDWLINWRQQFVWVEEQDVPSVAERLFNFHHSLSPEDFQNVQVNCRELWEDWLSPVGFFANFYRHFQL